MDTDALRDLLDVFSALRGDVVEIDDTGRAVPDSPAMPHGGARENSGRRAVYRDNEPKAFAMDFTPAGRRALDAIVRRVKLSRNDVLTHLTAEHAAELRFDADVDVVYPGKAAANVLSIRMPAHVGALLRAARTRTGKSYSDLGEELVRRYGRRATYPTLDDDDEPAAPRRRTGRRRARVSPRRRRP